jgi:hypothetical protein
MPLSHTGGWPATDDSLRDMKRHLQTAVLIELSTIPVYLYAAYSIKDDNSASKIICGF